VDAPRAGSNLHYYFCRTCGIRTPGRGEHRPQGAASCVIPVASLDDADPKELAAAPIAYVDGRQDRYDRPPEETRLM